MSRYGVSINSYTTASYAHAELARELVRRGIPALRLYGAPYPEVARAEQVRQALIGDIETLVFVDAHIDTTIDDVERLVMASERSGRIAIRQDSWPETALECAAVPRDVLERMVEAEARRYANSAVGTSWTGQHVDAVPLASPWNRDGSPIVKGVYSSDSEAFMARALGTGAEVLRHYLPGTANRRPPIRYRAVNMDAPITDEPGSRFALCIPSFGGLDYEQLTAVQVLERAGMTVFGIHDCPWIDQARSWLAEQAMRLGKGVFFVDHDIQFMPNDVLRLCAEALERRSVVAGAYCMRKSGRSIIGSFDVPPGPLPFFKGGATYPAFYSGLGFVAIPEGILAEMRLEGLSSTPLGTMIRPWFALDCSTGFYAGEDVSFCNRVHDLKVEQKADDEWGLSHSGRPCRVFIDTRVRIAHRGTYDYGIEDVGLVVPRVESLTTIALSSRAEARAALQSVMDLPIDTQLEQLPFIEEKPAYPKSELL